MSSATSEEKQDSPVITEVVSCTRQRRHSGLARDFKCPCGKTYLSYPALFTHIKQKHGGQAPGQIVKPNTNSQSKRGRPKIRSSLDAVRTSEPQIPSRTLDEPAKVLGQLAEFLRKIPKVETDLKPFYDSTPLHHLYHQRMTADSAYVDHYGNSFGLPAERALSEFLYGMTCYVDTPNEFIPELTTLMCFLLDHLHSSGASEHAMHISSLKLIEVVNDFILQFQERYGKSLKAYGEVPPFFQLHTLIKVIEYVFEWLYKKRYSHSWVKINQSFLDYVK